MTIDPVDYWVSYGGERTKISPYSYKVSYYNNIIFIISPSDVKKRVKTNMSRSRAKCTLCNKFLPDPGYFDESILKHFREKHKGIKP